MEKLVRRQYTVEFKQEAVKLLMNTPARRLSEIARELGIEPKRLSSWKKAYEEGRLTERTIKAVSPEQAELSRLRAENQRLKMERDILKKAAAYFAAASK